MIIVASNVIRVSDPTLRVLTLCRRDLTLDNPDFEKKERMGFWTGDTPRKLQLYEEDGGDLILPHGYLRNLIDLCKNERYEFTTKYAKNPPVDFRCEVPLYDYQERAVRVLQVCGGGILQSPAGSGKTQMGIALAAILKGKTLWLCHTADLLKQSKDRALLYMNKDLIGTITEGKVSIGKGITFATIQTMCKLDLDRYRDVWDVIIVDECHRAAGTPTTMTRFYKVLNSLAAPFKYGLSATVHRSDGLIRATYALLGEIAYTVPDEAVKEKVMPVTVWPVWTGRKSLIDCTNWDGTINYARLINSLCADEHRNGVILGAIEGNRGHPSLILSDRLEHLETLMNFLPRDMAAEAKMISGKMVSKKGKAEREDAIEGMRTGKYKYLFATYSLAKEGLDIPCLERLYMATPVKDYAVVVQSIGRIARTNPGKEDPVCYDFVDSIGYLQRAFKERCRHYRKANCKIKGE